MFLEPSYLGEGKVKIKDGLGSMQVGWIKINEKWYYFNSDGSMAVDTIISGYNIGPDGAWIQ